MQGSLVNIQSIKNYLVLLLNLTERFNFFNLIFFIIQI
jgi:hypothetical protein